MGSPLRILHLEDDPHDAEIIQGVLEAGGIVCEISRVETRDQFTAALQEGSHDLILADLSLPSFDGLSALKIAMQQRPGMPFIFVSGKLGEEVASRGAQDRCDRLRAQGTPVEAGEFRAQGPARGHRAGRAQAGRAAPVAQRGLPGRGPAHQPHGKLGLGAFERRGLLVRGAVPHAGLRAGKRRAIARAVPVRRPSGRPLARLASPGGGDRRPAGLLDGLPCRAAVRRRPAPCAAWADP